MANATTWMERVTQWRESGLTAREFCALRGIARSSLYLWSSKLERPTTTAGTLVRLARVTRTPAISNDVQHRGVEAAVVAEFDGARIFVPRDIEAAFLAMVVEVIQRRSAR